VWHHVRLGSSAVFHVLIPYTARNHCVCTHILRQNICYFLAILTEIEPDRQVLLRMSNVKCHENPSERCGVVPCEQRKGETEKTKLTDA
jgi:hypothetical protein